MTDPLGYLHVQFPVLEQGAQDLVGVHAKLVSTLEQLQADLQSSLAEWSSDAQHAFQTCQKNWQNDANDMAGSLARFGDFVAQARERYVNAEAKNTGIWT